MLETKKRGLWGLWGLECLTFYQNWDTLLRSCTENCVIQLRPGHALTGHGSLPFCLCFSAAKKEPNSLNLETKKDSCHLGFLPRKENDKAFAKIKHTMCFIKDNYSKLANYFCYFPREAMLCSPYAMLCSPYAMLCSPYAVESKNKGH